MSMSTAGTAGQPASSRAISFWYSQLDPTPPHRQHLSGSRRADVCIVGAGYTGLWTAYELLRRQPSLDVVVLEAEVAGFGASGRNGGWVEGMVAGDRQHWAGIGGREGAARMAQAIQDAVDEIGRVVAVESIDCGFRKGGSLKVAQTELEVRRLRAELEEDRVWGLRPDDVALLDRDGAASRIAVDGVLAATYTPHCARVQPAALAVGLAGAGERAGAVIYESTPVTRIDPGIAHTPFGDVRASFVVRATEGYTVSLEGQRRAMLPLTSCVIATEPLGPEVWEQLGWSGAETMWDARRRYVYLQRSPDDRIVIGGRGVPYRFASRTDAEGPPPADSALALRARLVELFPALHDVRIDGAWYGVLGAPRQWAPAVGVDRATGLAWAGGYVGQGVAAANLAGRTLADLLLETRSELTELPWVGTMGRPWPPEPIRFAAVRGVNAMLRFADRAELASGRTSAVGHLAHLISGR
ncbi:MAG: FAD-dependent oxidoreductase [Actinomycetota bacterium]|nr:FAD-dependent oxidoreductase [Actinomycetota bacterium]